MDCVLDNIIFSLQKSGGVSIVWKEHIQRLLKQNEVSCHFVEYENANENIFRKELDIPSANVEFRSKSFLSIKRYLDLNLSRKLDYIFHSSYYRTDRNKLAINVTTVHDFTYEYFVKGIRKHTHYHQKKNAIQNSEAIICVSQSTKKDLLKFVPGVAEEKISVIYNGVNPCYSIISIDEYKLSLPFGDKEFILFVGMRSVPYKNFSTVIDICANLKLPLILVGGEFLLEKDMNELNSKLGKGHYCHYKGISTEMLNELYNRALALLYPSLYEGFGIPIIEAQKAGCPVVAYANSSIPEVMGESDLLLKEISFYNVLDAVSILIRSSTVRQNEISRGLINASRFSWDTTYNQTFALYRDLLK